MMTQPKFMTDTDSTGIHNCVAKAARQASRRLTQFYDAQLAPSGLRSTQYAILAELERAGELGIGITDLARIMVMERSAMGQTLRPLERDGLIEFGTAPADARRKPLRLTDNGLRRILDARPLWEGAQTRVLDLFGQDPIARLRSELLGIAAEDRLS
jgi:DNA-binding MarR family transcriptional regulator